MYVSIHASMSWYSLLTFRPSFATAPITTLYMMASGSICSSASSNNITASCIRPTLCVCVCVCVCVACARARTPVRRAYVLTCVRACARANRVKAPIMAVYMRPLRCASGTCRNKFSAVATDLGPPSIFAAVMSDV